MNFDWVIICQSCDTETMGNSKIGESPERCCGSPIITVECRYITASDLSREESRRLEDELDQDNRQDS